MKKTESIKERRAIAMMEAVQEIHLRSIHRLDEEHTPKKGLVILTDIVSSVYLLCLFPLLYIQYFLQKDLHLWYPEIVGGK